MSSDDYRVECFRPDRRNVRCVKPFPHGEECDLTEIDPAIDDLAEILARAAEPGFDNFRSNSMREVLIVQHRQMAEAVLAAGYTPTTPEATS